jgi:hypothetical protein
VGVLPPAYRQAGKGHEDFHKVHKSTIGLRTQGPNFSDQPFASFSFSTADFLLAEIKIAHFFTKPQKIANN